LLAPPSTRPKTAILCADLEATLALVDHDALAVAF
jgi:hypothetical protein